MVMAAVAVGSAVVGAAGSMSAAHTSAKATSKSAKTAVGEQREARLSSERMSAPYRALGEKAVGTYEELLGLGPKGSAGIAETLSALPGYQFAKSQGIEGTSRALAAQGLNLSGNQATALADYTTGLADQTYGEQLNRLLAPIQLGQASAAGQAAGNQQSATNIGNIAVNQGNTIAGIRSNEIAGVTGAISNGVNQWTTQHTLQGLQTPGGGLPPPMIPGGTSGGAIPTYGS